MGGDGDRLSFRGAGFSHDVCTHFSPQSLPSPMTSINTTTFALLFLASAAISPCVQAAETQADAVSKAIEGEFALQTGDAESAARNYLAAAMASNDPDLAEHAVRIAILANNMAVANAALNRWRQLAPDNPLLGGVAIHIDLLQGRRAPALAEAQRMLKQPKGWQSLVAPLADTQSDQGEAAR